MEPQFISSRSFDNLAMCILPENPEAAKGVESSTLETVNSKPKTDDVVLVKVSRRSKLPKKPRSRSSSYSSTDSKYRLSKRQSRSKRSRSYRRSSSVSRARTRRRSRSVSRSRTRRSRSVSRTRRRSRSVSRSRTRRSRSVSRPRTRRRSRSVSRSRTRRSRSVSRSRTRRSRSISSERSRSRSRSRSRRHSISRSSRPRSRRRSYSSPRSARSQGPRSKLPSDPLDDKVRGFLDEEQLLIERMNLEKRDYMSAPELHPDYSREWERFYQSKSATYGRIHSSYLHQEWAEVWKEYFLKQHETKVKENRNRLMNRHKVFYSEIREYKERRAMEDARQSEMKAQTEVVRNGILTGGQEENQRWREAASSNPIQDMEVTVRSTLRLLTAIERDLGDLSSRVDQALLRAASCEDEETLLQNHSLIELFRACREVLLKIGPCSKQREIVIQACIKNIGILIDKSKTVSRTSVEVTGSVQTCSNPVVDMAVKRGIAEKISQEYEKLGRTIHGRALQGLVDNEFCRVTSFSNPVGPLGSSKGPAFGSKDPLGLSGNSDPTSSDQCINWAQLHAAAASINKQNLVGSIKTEPKVGDGFDDLTIEELTSLFKNFKGLDRSIQERLIEYMKRLEKTNPDKVQRLKQCIHSNTV